MPSSLESEIRCSWVNNVLPKGKRNESGVHSRTTNRCRATEVVQTTKNLKTRKVHSHQVQRVGKKTFIKTPRVCGKFFEREEIEMAADSEAGSLGNPRPTGKGSRPTQAGEKFISKTFKNSTHLGMLDVHHGLGSFCGGLQIDTVAHCQ